MQYFIIMNFKSQAPMSSFVFLYFVYFLYKIGQVVDNTK